MTRTTWTLACLLLALTIHLCASDRRLDPRIRSTEPELLDALAQGTTISPTLRHLVDRLDDSDVVVFLAFDRSAAPRMAGHLGFLTAVPGRRYLRVSIDRRNTGCRRLAILGHELQHAVEIAESPSVTDNATLVALYERIGFRSAGDQFECFDSAGAILAGRSVEKEVLAAGRAAGSR